MNILIWWAHTHVLRFWACVSVHTQTSRNAHTCCHMHAGLDVHGDTHMRTCIYQDTQNTHTETWISWHGGVETTHLARHAWCILQHAHRCCDLKAHVKVYTWTSWHEACLDMRGHCNMCAKVTTQTGILLHTDVMTHGMWHSQVLWHAHRCRGVNCVWRCDHVYVEICLCMSKYAYQDRHTIHTAIHMYVWRYLYLRPHGLQHTRLPCPRLSPWVFAYSHPLSWWCHLTISPSATPFSSCPQSFPAFQGLFQWVGSLHQVAKVLELQLQHQSFHWKFRVDFF